MAVIEEVFNDYKETSRNVPKCSKYSPTKVQPARSLAAHNRLDLHTVGSWRWSRDFNFGSTAILKPTKTCTFIYIKMSFSTFHYCLLLPTTFKSFISLVDIEREELAHLQALGVQHVSKQEEGMGCHNACQWPGTNPENSETSVW